MPSPLPARLTASCLRTLVLVLLVGCDGASPPAGPPAPTEAQKLSARGRARLAVGDLDGAGTLFQQAIRADDADPRGHIGLAAIALAKGDDASAHAALSTLRTRGVDVRRTAPWLSAIVDARRKSNPAPRPSALDAPADASAPPPDAPKPSPSTQPPRDAKEPLAPEPPVRALTPVERAAKQLFEARRFAELIEQHSPRKDRSWYESRVLADSYHSLGRWKQAVDLYRDLLTKRSLSEHVTHYLADALLRLKRYDESITFYELLAKRRPKEPGFWRLVGDAQAAKGDKKGARESYQKAIAGGYPRAKLEPALDALDVP